MLTRRTTRLLVPTTAIAMVSTPKKLIFRLTLLEEDSNSIFLDFNVSVELFPSFAFALSAGWWILDDAAAAAASAAGGLNGLNIDDMLEDFVGVVNESFEFVWFELEWELLEL